MMNTGVPDRERRLLEQVISLAHALRQERERLARLLSDLEEEIAVLALKLDGRPTVITLAHGGRRRS